MTGIINPDGTIGPGRRHPGEVHGLDREGQEEARLPDRHAAGRSPRRPAKLVDLVKLAKDHGAEAVEIANVHDAYRLLTGKQLPEPCRSPRPRWRSTRRPRRRSRRSTRSGSSASPASGAPSLQLDTRRPPARRAGRDAHVRQELRRGGRGSCTSAAWSAPRTRGCSRRGLRRERRPTGLRHPRQGPGRRHRRPRSTRSRRSTGLDANTTSRCSRRSARSSRPRSAATSR